MHALVVTWRTGLFLLHGLLVGLRVILVYSCLIACYYVWHKQILVKLREFQILIRYFALTFINFLVKHSGDMYRLPASTSVRTSANAHGVSYLMYTICCFAK